MERWYRMRPLRSRVPRRRGSRLLRLHRPRFHHERQHTLRGASPARRLHHLRALRNGLPHGSAHFNERALSSYRVDESRCILCRACVEVCPVEAIKETKPLRGLASEVARTGRPRQPAGRRSPDVRRLWCTDSGAPGAHGRQRSRSGERSHRLPRGEHHHLPVHCWKGSFIHSAFENASATLSGVETAFRALKKKGEIQDNVKFIAFGGDGSSYDIGLQSLSGRWNAVTTCFTSATTTART